MEKSELREFLCSLDWNFEWCDNDEQYKTFIKDNKEELKKKLNSISDEQVKILDKLFKESEITNDKDKYS